MGRNMTWVLFVITVLSGGSVQVESAGRFANAHDCRRAAVVAMLNGADAATCEMRREIDA